MPHGHGGCQNGAGKQWDLRFQARGWWVGRNGGGECWVGSGLCSWVWGWREDKEARGCRGVREGWSRGAGGERVQGGPPPDPTAAQTRTWWVGGWVAP